MGVVLGQLVSDVVAQKYRQCVIIFTPGIWVFVQQMRCPFIIVDKLMAKWQVCIDSLTALHIVSKIQMLGKTFDCLF